MLPLSVKIFFGLLGSGFLLVAYVMAKDSLKPETPVGEKVLNVFLGIPVSSILGAGAVIIAFLA